MKDCFDVGVTENHKLYLHFKRGFKYFWIFLQGITLFPTLQHNIGAMFATIIIGTRIRSIDWPENNHTVCSQSEKSKQQQNLGKYMHNILHYEGETNTIQTGWKTPTKQAELTKRVASDELLKSYLKLSQLLLRNIISRVIN